MVRLSTHSADVVVCITHVRLNEENQHCHCHATSQRCGLVPISVNLSLCQEKQGVNAHEWNAWESKQACLEGVDLRRTYLMPPG